jgi:hypothetical protein
MNGWIGGPRQRMVCSRCPSCRDFVARRRKVWSLIAARARTMHETPQGDRGDGCATGQPSRGTARLDLRRTCSAPRKVRETEDARKDGPIRGGSRWFVHNAS